MFEQLSSNISRVIYKLSLLLHGLRCVKPVYGAKQAVAFLERASSSRSQASLLALHSQGSPGHRGLPVPLLPSQGHLAARPALPQPLAGQPRCRLEDLPRAPQGFNNLARRPSLGLLVCAECMLAMPVPVHVMDDRRNP